MRWAGATQPDKILSSTEAAPSGEPWSCCLADRVWPTHPAPPVAHQERSWASLVFLKLFKTYPIPPILIQKTLVVQTVIPEIAELDFLLDSLNVLY